MEITKLSKINKNHPESKSHHSYGINISRLINREAYKNFDQLIKCKICFNILVNPNDCEKCGNTFCHDCINTIFTNKGLCPFNCENFTIKPSSLAITSFLSSLKFYCINKDLDCAEHISYLQVASHDKECSFSFSHCPNVKCNKKIRRQLLESHIRKECEYSLFKCDNCEIDYNRNDYLEHVDNCKNVENIFDVKKAIIDEGQNTIYSDIPLKEMSINNFMRMILFQMGKLNLNFDKKLEFINSEIKGIKDDINKFNKDNILYIENINNEIEVMNERVSHIETGLSANEGMKKMVEENIRETLFIRDSVFTKEKVKDEICNTNHNNHNNRSISKPFTGSKQNSSSISTSNTVTNTSSGNNSKQNSTVMNVIKIVPKTAEKEKEENNTSNTNNVKNLNIRSMQKINNRSPNRSPVAIQTHHNTRSPNPNSNPNPNPNPKTYNVETESFNNKTGHMTLIKSMIKNQETLLEHLNKLYNKLENDGEKLNIEMIKNKEELKHFIQNEVVDELKAYTLETSLDNSNRILKKIDDSILKK